MKGSCQHKINIQQQYICIYNQHTECFSFCDDFGLAVAMKRATFFKRPRTRARTLVLHREKSAAAFEICSESAHPAAKSNTRTRLCFEVTNSNITYKNPNRIACCLCFMFYVDGRIHKLKSHPRTKCADIYKHSAQCT